MLLDKMRSGVACLSFAGTFQGILAVPVNDRSDSGLAVRDDAPKVFYYDSPHLVGIESLITPAEGMCNMLLSVKTIGADVSTGKALVNYFTDHPP
jgi:hypothetical protein